MDTRELYKQKFEAQIREWSAKIDVFAAHTDKLEAQAQLDLKPYVDSTRTKLEAARAKLVEVASATDDKWDDVKKGSDQLWTDLKATVEGAYDALKPHQKS